MFGLHKKQIDQKYVSYFSCNVYYIHARTFNTVRISDLYRIDPKYQAFLSLQLIYVNMTRVNRSWRRASRGTTPTATSVVSGPPPGGSTSSESGTR